MKSRNWAKSAILALTAAGVLLLLLLVAIVQRSWRWVLSGQQAQMTVPRKDNIYELPKNLPVPVDDGACSHLVGFPLPPIPLMSTTGRRVDLSSLTGRTVVYCYPRTDRKSVV